MSAEKAQVKAEFHYFYDKLMTIPCPAVQEIILLSKNNFINELQSYHEAVQSIKTIIML